MSQNLYGLKIKLDAIGVTPPDAMANAIAVWGAVNETQTADVLADLARAVESCSIDPKDAVKQVKAGATLLAQRDFARQVAQNLDHAFRVAERVVIRDHADEIVERMRPKFDESVAVIGDALELLGPDPQAAAVRGAGPVVHEMYDRWETAVQTVDKITAVRSRMVVLGYGADVQRVTWFLAQASDQDAVDIAQQVYNGSGNGITHLAHACHRLHLNTAAESAALAITAQQATQRAAAAQAADTAAKNAEFAEATRDAWKNATVAPRG